MHLFLFSMLHLLKLFFWLSHHVFLSFYLPTQLVLIISSFFFIFGFCFTLWCSSFISLLSPKMLSRANYSYIWKRSKPGETSKSGGVLQPCECSLEIQKNHRKLDMALMLNDYWDKLLDNLKKSPKWVSHLTHFKIFKLDYFFSKIIYMVYKHMFVILLVSFGSNLSVFHEKIWIKKKFKNCFFEFFSLRFFFQKTL